LFVVSQQGFTYGAFLLLTLIETQITPNIFKPHKASVSRKRSLDI